MNNDWWLLPAAAGVAVPAVVAAIFGLWWAAIPCGLLAFGGAGWWLLAPWFEREGGDE